MSSINVLNYREIITIKGKGGISMRMTNEIMYKMLACFIISVLLLGYLPAPANAQPGNLTASAITQTSATLTWTAASGPVDYYRVYKDESIYINRTTNTSITITGLQASKTYSFEVYAIKKNGKNTFSQYSFTTLPAVPAVPTGLSSSAITQTSATLTWTATSGATSYKVYRGETVYAISTTNTASITGLTADTAYFFRVSAVNAGGEGNKSTALSLTTLPAVPLSTLKVLEIQPGTNFDLSTDLLSSTFPNNLIDLTKMSMPEFISKVDEINGKYDIVYIGNSSLGTQYSALGTDPTNLPQGGLNNGTGTSKEYYSDNDITNRRANTLKDFIYSKQLIIFDQTIFESRSTKPKLYDNFLSFRNNPTYPNFKTANIRNAGSQKISLLGTAFSSYNVSNVSKRPVLVLNSQPLMYNGTDASYQTDKSLGFNFDIDNQSNANNMAVKLYIDINGDGIFKATDNSAGKSEQVFKMDNINSDTGYTMNFRLPDSFVGLQPWKLELTDTSTASTDTTGTKSYVTGATAFKGVNSGDELNIRLLQLVPSGNTLSINSLRNVNGQNLLYKDKVYRINVTEMTIANFNAAYTQTTPPPVTAQVNGVTTNAPTILNGNYDMLIMGFADIYGGGDLTNTKAIDAFKSFIDTNQSVMLTHDTLTFQVNSPNTWGYNITQNFRSIVGQQRYYRTAPDSTRYYDPMPNASKDSYGFTNLTLARYNNGIYNNGQTFQTTTQTHKLNDNLVTQFPFPLGNITVAATHFQYFQLDLEDENVVPVYTLTNGSGSTIYNDPGDGRNNYYTYTKGNITYSGTGHDVPNNLPEQQMFINTMIKASRGANHAPTLEVNGIIDGMNIANTLPSIDFSFVVTDIDINDQYQNAEIYLSTSNDGTSFSDYQKVLQYSAADPDLSKRIKSGVAQSVSIPTVNSSVNAYKVKVVAFDSFNAMVSEEFRLNNVADPQISVDSFTASCLVGDTLTIPVNVTATATALNETFKNITLQSNATKIAADGTSIPIDAHTFNNYPDLTFSPNPVWSGPKPQNSYQLTLGSKGDPSSAGTYNVLNKLTYSAYYGVPDSSPGISRENTKAYNISVGSGTLDVVVLDQKGRGITGIPLTVSGPHTGTTNTSGFYSLAGLSSGDYSVTVTVPTGRSIVGSTSQTVSLSADSPYQKITFTMGGDLITDPSIKSRSGLTQLSNLKNAPIQTNIGFNLTRPASSLNVDLNSSLNGSTANVVVSKVYRNSQEINFSSSGGTILPSPGGSFPSGTYTIEATVIISGGTMQVGQSFTVSLTQQTSAQDANTGSVEPIASPSPLTVNVIWLISNPKITTNSGDTQMSIFKNSPLQVVAGFDLALPAKFLKIDMSNSYLSTMNVAISKLYCNNEEIGFSVSDGKLFPSQTNTFPSGTYRLNTIVTLNGGIMQEGQAFTIELTDLTSAQEAITEIIENINSVSLSLKVNIGSSPKLH